MKPKAFTTWRPGDSELVPAAPDIRTFEFVEVGRDDVGLPMAIYEEL